MTRKSLVVIVAFLFSLLRTSDAAALPKINNVTTIKSIFDEIAGDESICTTNTVFRDSQYTKNCEQAIYPNKSVTLDSSNAKQFLCLGIYDRIYRLCYLGSLPNSRKNVFPPNTAEFDTLVKNSMPKNRTETLNFCINWKNPYPPKYSKIKEHVDQLEKAMGDILNCLQICTNWEGHFENMCSVIALMDKISSEFSIQSEIPRIEKTEESAGLTNVAPSQTTVTNKQIIEKDKSEKSEKTATEQERVPSKPEVPEKKEKNIEVAAKVESSKQENPKQDNPKREKILAQAAEASAKNSDAKKEDILQPDVQPKTPKNLAHDQRKTGEEVAQKDSQVAPPRASGEETDVDRAPVDHGNSNEETDKIPVLPEDQNDPRNDVISDHTRDEEGGAVDPSEDANELESPPSSNEDLNDVPAQTSEKREFVPRMPGFRNDDDSHFFGYFTVIGVICIAGYVGYHNKQKIMAMILEGRRSRGGRGRRRPSTANYRKLDCTLEEAVTSQCNSNVTHVIY